MSTPRTPVASPRKVGSPSKQSEYMRSIQKLETQYLSESRRGSPSKTPQRLSPSPFQGSPLPRLPGSPRTLSRQNSDNELCFVDSRLTSPTTSPGVPSTPTMRAPSFFCSQFEVRGEEENTPPGGDITKRNMPLPARPSLQRSPRKSSLLLFPASSPKRNLASKLAGASKEQRDLPIDIQIIVDSRPKSIHPDLDGFEGKTYKDFWLLSNSEANQIREWDGQEFERQSRVFEYFSNLLRIRFNMKRVVEHYGPSFQSAKGLTPNQESDYNKTFVQIKSLYDYLNRFVQRKLLPAFDGHMFVDDKYVMDVSKKWLTNVAAQYEYISRSVVYLARLSSNESVRSWLEGAEATDEASRGNRFAPSSKELFSSYFLKLFTPVSLILRDLSKLYGKMDMPELAATADELTDKLAVINKTSDYTTDLENKIALNEQLVCADYLYLEMVDLFSPERHLRPEFEMETRHGVQWTKCKLVLTDNYLLPLMEKKHKDASLFLAKPPTALQYLSYSVTDANDGNDDGCILTIRDCGNEITHIFRTPKGQKMASMMLKSFTKDLDKYRKELFTKLSGAEGYKPRLINNTTFASDILEDPYVITAPGARPPKIPSVPALSNSVPLCADSFLAKSGGRFWVIGSTDGLYVGQPGYDWRLVCRLARVSRVDVLEQSTMVVLQAADKVYRCTTDALSNAYKAGAMMTEKELKELQKHVQGHELAVQQFRRGPMTLSARFIFTWKDKKVRYSPLNADNDWVTDFRSMRAAHSVKAIRALEPSHFAIMHQLSDDQPVFYLSNLSSMTNTQLPKVDEDPEMEVRQKGQSPVAAFKMMSRSGGAAAANEYEIILVYTRYCILVSYDPKVRAFKRSRNTILRLNFDCTDAAFDAENQTLIVAGARAVEAWQIPERQTDNDARPQLVACLLGHEVSLLNHRADALIVSLQRGTGEARRELYRLCKN